MSELKLSHTHIVEDEQGNEKYRFDVKSCEDKINISDKVVEAGEIVQEMVKYYNKSLWRAIEDHRDLGRNRLYFQVKMKRNPYDHNKFHLKILPHRKELSKLYEDCDFYLYDYEKDSLIWLWSVPHKVMFKNFLSDESKYDKNLIKCIKEFLKQENLKLEDFKPSKIIPIK